jgi:hypothetical protein
MDLYQPPLSVTKLNGMTITVYPQLTLIERGSYSQKYIGYSKKESIKKFRKYCKEQKAIS